MSSTRPLSRSPLPSAASAAAAATPPSQPPQPPQPASAADNESSRDAGPLTAPVASYGVVADRHFSSVALVLDPAGTAARLAASPTGPQRQQQLLFCTEDGAPLPTLGDIAAMSPTSAARADVNAAAVVAGVDFRVTTAGHSGGDDSPPASVPIPSSSSCRPPPPSSSHSRSCSRGDGRPAQVGGREREDAAPRLPPSLCPDTGEAPPNGPPKSALSDANSSSSGSEDGASEYVRRHAWMQNLSFGHGQGVHGLFAAGDGGGGGGCAALDPNDTLFALAEETYKVLRHYFPGGAAAEGASDESSTARGADAGETAGRHVGGCLGSGSSGDESGSWDVYALPFLDSADARAKSTFPAGGASSEDATADTPFLTLLVLLTRLVGPVAVTQLLRTSMGLITTAFMGHYLDTEQFAAAATGLAFTNLTALNIGNGFSAALDTLATQEHGRRKHSPEIVAILIRATICTFIVYIPIAVLYFFCEPILAAVIHEQLVADTAYFLRWSVFIATPMILNNNLIKFAQSQKITQLGVISSVTGVVTLLPLLFLIARTHGIPGVIVALSINRCMVLAVVVYCLARNRNLAQCWHGRSVIGHFTAVLRDGAAFVHFVRVGLPILGANCADSWAFEALGIIAAHIGPVSAATWNVINAIYNQLFALHIGIAAGAAIRVGNAVGAGKGLLARRYVLATLAFATACTSVCVLAMWIFGKTAFDLLQRNPEVSARGGEISFIAGITFASDSLFYVMQGPFRGAGYNGVLLCIVAACMWGITVPLALVLGVALAYDVEGILVALFIGMSVAFPTQTAYLLWFVPWERHEEADDGDGDGDGAGVVVVEG